MVRYVAIAVRQSFLETLNEDFIRAARAFDLSVAHERACGLIGGERSQGTRIPYLLELNRGLGVPIEPCQNIAVGNAVFP